MNLKTSNIKDIWIKASVVGSIWASIEIIFGNFLHSFKIPMNGTILAAIGVILLISINQAWKVKGLFWRAGIICAMIKSISPSAIIIGPMIAIIIESFILEFSTRLLGRTIFGYIIGSALVVTYPIIQNTISLLFVYGFDLLQIYYKTVDFALKNLNIVKLDPWNIFIIFVFLHTIIGIIAGVIGIIIGKKVNQFETDLNFRKKQIKNSIFNNLNIQIFHPYLIIFHFLFITIGLILIKYSIVIIFTLFILSYVIICFFIYDNIRNKFLNKRIWIEFFVLVFLSVLLLTNWDVSDSLTSGLIIGYQMILRAFTIMIGFSCISIELRNPIITNWFIGAKMNQLYYALELAFESLPFLIERISKKRKSFKNPLKILSELLYYAENIVKNINTERRRIIIITGEINSGKTTFALSLSENLRNNGNIIGGILSIGKYNNGEIDKYEVLDLTEQNTKLLCDREVSNSIFSHGRFHFKEEGIEFGTKALNYEKVKNCDYIFIDELGNLELKGSVWANSLKDLLEKELNLILIVRNNCVQKIINEFKFEYEKIFEINKYNLEEVFEFINQK